MKKLDLAIIGSLMAVVVIIVFLRVGALETQNIIVLQNQELIKEAATQTAVNTKLIISNQDKIINITKGVNSLLNKQGINEELASEERAQLQTIIGQHLKDTEDKQILLNRITDLENQVSQLKGEIVVLKDQVANLTNQLAQSKLIIAEQQKNITASN